MKIYGGCLMSFSNLTPTLIDAEMSLAEKGITSLKVILTGFVVVFSVLLLLILIIKIYSAIVQKAQRGVKLKKEKIKEETISVTPVPVTTAPVAMVADDTVPEEVVAVISAAVASMYGSSSKVRIKSIKKSGAGRSAWANAGVFENTRPF